MQVTLELPDNINTMSPEKQKENIFKALQDIQIIKGKRKMPMGKSSKWAKIAQRVENDPVHLKGYSEQLKKDIKEFRDNFDFKHDQ
ncbi:hypothetical protein H8E88_01575 [candidate division KSB1 bacterium]|nr:hypothetical protein [candidate division KSB1 bacterium]